RRPPGPTRVRARPLAGTGLRWDERRRVRRDGALRRRSGRRPLRPRRAVPAVVAGDEALLRDKGVVVNGLERVEAAAMRSAVAAAGGRVDHVGGALCLAHPELPIIELNRALPLGETIDLDAVE